VNPDAARHWHLITGEYPPDHGGIADYTRRVAEGLAERGQNVQVWANAGEIEPTSCEQISVHRIGGGWNKRDLARIGTALDSFPSPRRILVQYTPNVFGRKGMNLGLCSWLRRRRERGDDVRIVFHEIRYLERPGDSLARRFLSQVQRLMVRRLLRAARRVYVTIPYWNHLLEPFAPRVWSPLPAIWLPIASNISVLDDPDGVAEIRRALVTQDHVVIGNFGTFHDVIGEMVAETFSRLLLGQSDRVALLIGRGGSEFAAELIRRHPELSDRIVATGRLDDADVARHLRACDLMIQPYPDGVCTKRTSIMAALANGVPVATTTGKITEPFWETSEAVALAPEDDLPALVRKAEQLLNDSDARQRLARKGRSLYESEFTLSRLIDRLMDSDLPTQ
jgi:glycosyltransferase involved in cell wall biosynthesis